MEPHRQTPDLDYLKKIDEQNILLRVSQSIISTMDYQEVLQIISDGMAELLGIETAAIYLLEDKENLLMGATTPPFHPKMPYHEREAKVADHPNIRKVLETRQPVVIHDTLTAVLSEEEAKISKIRELRSILFLPFIQKEKVLGVLILGTKSDSRNFTEYEIELGQTVANQLSIGIQNARLHADVGAKNEQLRIEIGERQKAQQALKRSETHLSNALKIARLGHWEYDVETDIFTFTDEFYTLLRTSVERIGSYEMSSAEYAETFVHPDDRHLVKEEIRKSILSNDPDFSHHVEHRITFADGEAGHIAVRYRLTKDEDGNTVRLYGANQDITEIKRSEQQVLEALEKAEESDRLKSAFLANLSHEIRTPMNAIMGFSHLLKNDELSVEEKKKYIAYIEKGSTRLLRIISDIVDISKIDANILQLTCEEYNLNNLLDDLEKQFTLQLPSENLEIKTVKSLSDQDCVIFTDITRLTQVLSNLMENAIKFSRQGIIEIGYTIEKDSPLFFVKDPGAGIDKKYHDVIFERFRKLDVGTSQFTTGTGLGLSIVKSIIELMDGKIWLDSKPGKGSAFYFTIPGILNGGNGIQEKRKLIKSPGSKIQTILIAEDEPTNYMFLEALFSRYNYRTILAKNGTEAVEKFRNHPETDLIMMDLKMPGMNGLDATREIRKINSNVPIIAQTAYAMAEDRRVAMEAGCNEYLAKPITEDALAKVVNNYLG